MESKSTLKRLAVQKGHGSGLITTRERFRLTDEACKAAAEWNKVSFPAAPEERLKDRAVGFADGFTAAIAVLIAAGIIVENTERES